jgi:hypothetical protein
MGKFAKILKTTILKERKKEIKQIITHIISKIHNTSML